MTGFNWYVNSTNFDANATNLATGETPDSEAMAYLMGQIPSLQAHGISSYYYVASNTSDAMPSIREVIWESPMPMLYGAQFLRSSHHFHTSHLSKPKLTISNPTKNSSTSPMGL